MTDIRLAQIKKHWAQGDEYAQQADLVQYEANRLLALAEEQEEQAQDIVAAVLSDHPEWEEDLRWSRTIPADG